jgi:hypothetical protein
MGKLFMLGMIAEAVASLDLTDAAAELYPVMTTHGMGMTVRPFDFALSERLAGLTAACAGEWDAADGHLSGALDQARQMPNALDLPQVEYWFGRMLIRRDRPADKARAKELLESAHSGFRGIGIPVRAEQTAELLRSL